MVKGKEDETLIYVANFLVDGDIKWEGVKIGDWWKSMKELIQGWGGWRMQEGAKWYAPHPATTSYCQLTELPVTALLWRTCKLLSKWRWYDATLHPAGKEAWGPLQTAGTQESQVLVIRDGRIWAPKLYWGMWWVGMLGALAKNGMYPWETGDS